MMAKDPAFLFYTGDFSTGTQFFTDDQVGKYLRLLMAQHQHGRLTKNQVMFICKSYDEEILSKFLIDDEGLYYNQRLEYEANKRRSFSESRSKNKAGKNKDLNNTSKSYDYHMENENENENKSEKELKKSEKINFEEIAQEFNSVCVNLPSVQKLTDARIKVLKARISEHGLDKIGAVFKKVSESHFLNGKNDRGWIADFDWILKSANFIKIIEGKYKNIQHAKTETVTANRNR